MSEFSTRAKNFIIQMKNILLSRGLESNNGKAYIIKYKIGKPNAITLFSGSSLPIKLYIHVSVVELA